MVTHYWGDENVDWAGIDDAAAYIGNGLRKWGRVCVTQHKEKYGCVRVYCYLGLYDLQQLTHPGYAYNQWPKWMWRFQFSVPARALTCMLNVFFRAYHKWLYRRYYRKAVERWPHLREEILCDADHDELLEGL